MNPVERLSAFFAKHPFVCDVLLFVIPLALGLFFRRREGDGWADAWLYALSFAIPLSCGLIYALRRYGKKRLANRKRMEKFLESDD